MLSWRGGQDEDEAAGVSETGQGGVFVHFSLPGGEHYCGQIVLRGTECRACPVFGQSFSGGGEGKKEGERVKNTREEYLK